MFRWLRFRRSMREVRHRGPTLGVDLSCPDVGITHAWVPLPTGERLCLQCGDQEKLTDA